MEQHIQSRSCYRCNLKKIRCNKISPCQRCVGANVECAFPSPGRAPRQRKRPLKAELTTRLRLLEEKVHKLIDEGSNAPENHSDGNDPDLTRETISTEEKQCGRLLVGERTSRYVNHQALASLWDQVRVTTVPRERMFVNGWSAGHGAPGSCQFSVIVR